MTRRRVHYVLSTHWDREWYETFQEYRHRLVPLMDRVLDALADGRLVGPFTTDGQTIILEDYLEIRPERRPQLAQLLRERKLVAGPWYTLPDEFLVSGEALIRNLRLGRQVVREFGGQPSDAGFVCDLFGHISQLPQVFKGFGIRAAMVYRGVSLIGRRHFIWRGADGTEIPAYKFAEDGYADYAVTVRHVRQPEHCYDPTVAEQELAAYLQREAERTEIAPILLFDGGDHQEWDEQYYSTVRRWIEREDGPFEMIHSDLDQYTAEMLLQADRISERREGELRETGRLPEHQDRNRLPLGVASSRVGDKLANARCQSLLCHWAEPLNAVASWILGAEHPTRFLDVAWRWLLSNHAHDSICGCSIDAVHAEMQHRFRQCRQIAERLAEDASAKLAAHVAGAVTDDVLRIVVFNPLPVPFVQTTDLTLQIPTCWPTFDQFMGYEPQPAFRIYDAQEREVRYQRLGQAMNRVKYRTRPNKFPETYNTHDVSVSLPLRIPAAGYTTLAVRRGEPGLPTRHSEHPGLITSERSMENEYLAVEIEAGGTLQVTDKRTGHVYRRLLTFEDSADIGDGWYHGKALRDRVVVSSSGAAEVSVIHDGPMLSTLGVRVSLQVPEAFNFAGMTRSRRTVALPIESRVSLRPDADYLDVKTVVHNTAGDHRLRVLTPSGVDAGTYLSDCPFDVVCHPIALDRANHQYREPEVETRPQESWTAVYNEQAGLAVVSFGLLETAVRDLPGRPIALTIFRSTRRTFLTNGEPAGLLLGRRIKFRYRIVPLTGPPDRARLSHIGQQLAAGLRAMQLGRVDVDLFRQGDTVLPPAASFVRVDGPVVVTSIRRIGDGLEVRMFNPNETPAAGSMSVGREIVQTGGKLRAEEVDLESTAVGHAIPMQDGRCAFTLRPKQILTLRLTADRPAGQR